MSSQSDIRQHHGPYIECEDAKRFADLSEVAWSRFWKSNPTALRYFPKRPKVNLIMMLMHIANVTSEAACLNASWALSHAALSLLRDRYEQTIRFSWLAHQRDDKVLEEYIATFYAKANKVVRSFTPEQLAVYLNGTEPEPWMIRDFTPEEREFSMSWSRLDLRSMALKRDALLPSEGCKLARQRLAHWYRMYQELSSVTHYDMFSVRLLQMHRTTKTTFKLSTEPKFMVALTAFISLFDLIQAFEASHFFLGFESAEESFDSLYREWRALTKVIVPSLRGHMIL